MILVNEPLLNGNEKKYLAECIDTGWISSEGPFIKSFEEKMALTAGRKFGVAVSNGSVALDAAGRRVPDRERGRCGGTSSAIGHSSALPGDETELAESW